MSADPSPTVWFKSSHSGGQTDCVEVAWLAEGAVGVRDSRDPAGPALIFAPGEWDSFASGLAGGLFDRA